MVLSSIIHSAVGVGDGVGYHLASVDKAAYEGEEERVLAWVLAGVFRGD